MALIEDVLAREVLDSRGNPTVEVEVLLEDGTDLFTIKKLLGHSSISSTTVYLRLANVSGVVSPLDRTVEHGR